MRGRSPRAYRSTSPALLDLVEEPLDLIASPVQIWTETERVVAIPSSCDIRPCAIFAGRCSDPAGVISTVAASAGCVSIIWTTASWAAANASMIPLQTPARRIVFRRQNFCRHQVDNAYREPRRR